ncbi:MAG: CapA family protein [Patescibacteria group bacterium]|nr:CapA family protein [Patescibacteria group bacterium]
MGRIGKKKTPRARILIYCAILFCITTTTLVIQNHTKNNENEKSPSDKHTSEDTISLTYYISDKVPDNFVQEIQSIADEYEWVETDTIDSATISVSITKIEQINPENLNYYQVWILSKDWTNLVNNDITQITHISENIDEETAGQIIDGTEFNLPDSNTYSTDTGLSLLTIHEAKATQIPLEIDSYNPFDSAAWETLSYPLILCVQISADQNLLEILASQLSSSGFLSENDYLTQTPTPDDFVDIIKTGTTVAGGPGWELCEKLKGRNDYPIDNIKEILAGSDLTIISNESSFVQGCTQETGTTAFCGKPEYVQNLLDIGTDIISLTGNHMCDYGRSAFQETLDTYNNNGMSYFAAGRDSTEAWTPLLVETKAGKIAFIGFNRMGPDGVIATENLPGTADYNQDLLASAVNSAKSQGADIIWLDTHLWPEYDTQTSPEQFSITRECAELGANIVTGVSSHEIQGMEFYNDTPIFWGLGNFLFDQMWSAETRQGLLLKIYIYDKKIRQIELIPTLMHDYCQPRLMSGEEKNSLLEYFGAISNF